MYKYRSLHYLYSFGLPELYVCAITRLGACDGPLVTDLRIVP